MKIPSRTGVTAGVAPRPQQDGPPRGRRRAIVAGLVATGLVSSSLILPGVAAAALPIFPDNIVIFPNRDMVVLEGFDSRDGQAVTVEVYKGTQLMGAAKGSITAGGEFEINHPGGACWGNDPAFPQVTPDITAGDRVEVKFAEGGTTFVAADSTVQDGFVENVNYTDGATEFTVTGKVQAGKAPADMEQRIVNPDLTDTLVARRDIRAVVGGPAPGPRGGYTSNLVVDTATNTFTASYDFALSADQAVDNARTAATGGGERLMTWQETDAAGNRQGLTIAEFGETGGPGMGGCPAGPGSVAPTPGTYGAVWTGTTAQVSWSPAAAQPGAPAVSGYSIEAVAKTANAAGATPVVGVRVPATATRADVVVPSGTSADYTVEVRPLITGGGVGAAFATAGSTPGGPPPAPGDTTPPTVTAVQNAAGAVVLTADEANAEIYFTTDGTDPISGSGVLATTATLYTAPVPVTAATAFKAAAYDAAGNVSTVVSLNATPAQPPAATVPGAPAGVTLTPGNGTLGVSWTPPASTGGSPITGYKVAINPVAGTIAPPANPTQTTRNITGLVNGTQYSITVVATNAVGDSVASAPATGRPGDTVAIATARWKAGDFRVGGSGSVNGAIVTVHRVNADGSRGPAIAGATAAIAANTFNIRLRNGAAPAANPGRIMLVSNGGGQSAPFTVTNG
jgi:hypothetical protein